jgi:uncharacterized protein YhjY with autotransporter beta-barrel domain
VQGVFEISAGSITIQGVVQGNGTLQINASNLISLSANALPNPGSAGAIVVSSGSSSPAALNLGTGQKNLDAANGQTQGNIITINSNAAQSLPDFFPEEFALAPAFLLSSNRAMQGLLADKLAELRDLDSNGPSIGFRLLDPAMPLQVSAAHLSASMGSAPVRGAEFAPSETMISGTSTKRWHFFADGFGVLGEVDALQASAAYDFNTAGMVVGTNYQISETQAAGVFFGYSSTHADFGVNSSDMDLESQKIGAQATWKLGKHSWLDAVVSGGPSQLETSRTTTSGNLDGETDGWDLNALLGWGHEFRVGDWKTGPRFEAAYTYFQQNSYTEQDTSNLLASAYDDYEYNSLTTLTAWNVSRSWTVGRSVWRASLQAGWRHEYLDDNATLGATLLLPNIRVQGDGPAADRDSLSARAGMNVDLNEMITLSAGYETETNADYLTHKIESGITLRF